MYQGVRYTLLDPVYVMLTRAVAKPNDPTSQYNQAGQAERHSGDDSYTADDSTSVDIMPDCMTDVSTQRLRQAVMA